MYVWVQQPESQEKGGMTAVPKVGNTGTVAERVRFFKFGLTDKYQVPINVDFSNWLVMYAVDHNAKVKMFF